MCGIYKAPIEWNPIELNAFTQMGNMSGWVNTCL